MNLRGKTLVFAMAVGQVGGLLPHVAVPSTMPSFLIPEWGLSYGEAGLMASAYAIGYMLAAPVLTTLTDRLDGRGILILGSLLNAAGAIGFGLWADGMISAMLLWALTGIGFAGSYMPGLKALSDRLDPGESSRSFTFYTSAFSFGVGLSFLVCQLVAEAWGWRAAFVLTGLAPLTMTFVAWTLRPVTPAPRAGPVLDLAPALRNRAALGYSFAYGCHCFELYGLRTWLVAFWGFVAARGDMPLGAVVVSAVITIIAMPASILGNELALKLGRHRAVTLVMLLSAIVALCIGFTAGLSPWLTLVLMLIYAFTTPGDSGALTSGMAAAADPRFRGASMAVHSTVGFGLTAAGGWVVGVALDIAGGVSQPGAWALAYAVMAAAVALGPVCLWWSRRGTGARRTT
jgi:predicted MFS family arabinose efflux permease